LSRSSSETDCAMASRIKTPGKIAWPGKWPTKQSSLPVMCFRANNRFPRSIAVTRSIIKNGKRCARSPRTCSKLSVPCNVSDATIGISFPSRCLGNTEKRHHEVDDCVDGSELLQFLFADLQVIRALDEDQQLQGLKGIHAHFHQVGRVVDGWLGQLDHAGNLTSQECRNFFSHWFPPHIRF